jgi:hypothetical protein
VTVDIRSDGTYVLSFSTGGVSGQWKMEEVSEMKCHVGATSCNPYSTKNADSAPQTNLGGFSGDADGRVNAGKPEVLAGTVAGPIDFQDGSGSRTVT